MASTRSEMTQAEQSDLDDNMLDIDFLSSQSSASSSVSALKRSALTTANIEVLKYIYDAVDNVMSALEKDQDPCVVLKRTGSSRASTLGHAGEVRSITYSWPGKTPSEAWRFACTLAVLLEVKNAIENNVTVTKRDIYYRQPELYKKQETVDRLIDNIALTCDVTRKDLRVTASPKGLICGFSPSDEVLIVPEDPTIIETSIISHLRWILVVEKEASFKSLVEHNIYKCDSIGSGLIVTGKGYPDLNTKRLLRYVLDTCPRRVPIFGLFDADPDGLDIYRCYRIGSRRSSQESISDIAELKWLGVDMTDFLGEPSVMNETIQMSVRDRTRAANMLARDKAGFPERRKEPAIDATKQRAMLQHMLMLNVKMEIQAIDKSPGGLSCWLTAKLSTPE